LDDPGVVLTAGAEIDCPAEDAAPRPLHDRVKQAICGSTNEGDEAMSDKGARWAVGVFGDSAESGRWRDGTRTRAVAVFGDSTVDLGAATAGDEIVVRAVAGFGDVLVTVPAGSRVEISGWALFGDVKVA